MNIMMAPTIRAVNKARIGIINERRIRLKKEGEVVMLPLSGWVDRRPKVEGGTQFGTQGFNAELQRSKHIGAV
jgi:hypothetical protein